MFKKSCKLRNFIIVYFIFKKKKRVFFIFLACRPNEPVYFGQAFNGLDELVKSFKMIFYAKHGIKKMLNYAKDSHFLCFLFLKAWL
jgi:hypothetical protein